MSNKKKIIISICTLFLIILLLIYLLDKLRYIDTNIYKFISILRCNFLDVFFKFITQFGGVIFTILFLLLYIIIYREKSKYLLINVVIVVLINILLKNIIKRTRPVGINLIVENGYSFPSAHSMNSVALYGYLLYFSLKNNLNNIIDYIKIIVYLILLISIPISRIYLGVHFFSDVFAGICISTIWLCFYLHYIEKRSVS